MSQNNPELQNEISQVREQAKNIIANIEQVIKGKEEVIKKLLIAISANGHILLHDVPGVGKTMLARSLAKSIDAEFRRVQFTPDLLPTDITGVNIFNPNSREFEFKNGPIFTNIFLADEINRTSPKTQSALLEAMEERQVSMDNKTYILDTPFFVIATQNPIEHDGTYPLPAAQLDRFLMRLEIGYPNEETELSILDINNTNQKPVEKVQKILSRDHIKKWQEVLVNIHVSEEMKKYIVRLARATRDSDAVRVGVSPRATILLMKASQGAAMMDGRDYVIPDDIRLVIKDVFAHRLSEASQVGESIVDDIIAKVQY